MAGGGRDAGAARLDRLDDALDQAEEERRPTRAEPSQPRSGSRSRGRGGDSRACGDRPSGSSPDRCTTEPPGRTTAMVRDAIYASSRHPRRRNSAGSLRRPIGGLALERNRVRPRTDQGLACVRHLDAVRDREDQLEPGAGDLHPRTQPASRPSRGELVEPDRRAPDGALEAGAACCWRAGGDRPAATPGSATFGTRRDPGARALQAGRRPTSRVRPLRPRRTIGGRGDLPPGPARDPRCRAKSGLRARVPIRPHDPHGGAAEHDSRPPEPAPTGASRASDEHAVDRAGDRTVADRAQAGAAGSLAQPGDWPLRARPRPSQAEAWQPAPGRTPTLCRGRRRRPSSSACSRPARQRAGPPSRPGGAGAAGAGLRLRIVPAVAVERRGGHGGDRPGRARPTGSAPGAAAGAATWRWWRRRPRSLLPLSGRRGRRPRRPRRGARLVGQHLSRDGVGAAGPAAAGRPCRRP